jgi:hypothetical protein
MEYLLAQANVSATLTADWTWVWLVLVAGAVLLATAKNNFFKVTGLLAVLISTGLIVLHPPAPIVSMVEWLNDEENQNLIAGGVRGFFRISGEVVYLIIANFFWLAALGLGSFFVFSKKTDDRFKPVGVGLMWLGAVGILWWLTI